MCHLLPRLPLRYFTTRVPRRLSILAILISYFIDDFAGALITPLAEHVLGASILRPPRASCRWRRRLTWLMRHESLSIPEISPIALDFGEAAFLGPLFRHVYATSILP